MRAHLVGGVPTAEVEAQRAMFDALGFDPAQAFRPAKTIPDTTTSLPP